MNTASVGNRTMSRPAIQADRPTALSTTISTGVKQQIAAKTVPIMPIVSSRFPDMISSSQPFVQRQSNIGLVRILTQAANTADDPGLMRERGLLERLAAVSVIGKTVRAKPDQMP